MLSPAESCPSRGGNNYTKGPLILVWLTLLSSLVWILAAEITAGLIVTDQGPPSTALRVILITSSLFSLGAVVLSCRYETGSSDKNGFSDGLFSKFMWRFILAPAFALMIMLLLRLKAGENHFEGFAPGLDFGPKNGIPLDEDGGESNIAMEPEFNSYGHAIQGFLAALFVFPVVLEGLSGSVPARCSRGSTCQNGVLTLWKVFGSCMTIYPAYNFIKRVAKSWQTFATSSFCNNAMEWVLGFWLGFALGLLLQSMGKACCCRPKNDKKESDDVEQRGGYWNYFGEENEKAKDSSPPSPGLFTKLGFGLQYLLGWLLLGSVLGGGVLFGFTWNTCVDDGNDCVNFSEDGPELSRILISSAVPTIVYLVTFVATVFGDLGYDTSKR